MASAELLNQAQAPQEAYRPRALQPSSIAEPRPRAYRKLTDLELLQLNCFTSIRAVRGVEEPNPDPPRKHTGRKSCSLSLAALQGCWQVAGSNPVAGP